MTGAVGRLKGLGGLVGFGAASAAGLAVDLATFQVATQGGWPPPQSHLFSAAVGAGVTYQLAARWAARRAPARGLGLYLAHQLVVIAPVAGVIGLLCRVTDLAPLLAKVSAIPLTFTLNYLAYGLLSRRRSCQKSG